jgi:hypothetical protein
LQGSKAGKLFTTVALTFALVLAFGAGAAFADPTVELNKTEAKTKEAVEVTVSGLEFDDIWEVWIDDRPAQTANGEFLSGQADSPDPIKRDLEVPDLGNTDKDVDVKLFVTRPGVGTLPEVKKPVRYIAAVEGKGDGGGGTGSGTTTGGTTASTPAAITGPIGVVGPTVTGPANKSKKSEKKTKSKTKSKSGGNSTGGGSDKDNSNNTGGGSGGGGSSTPTYTAPPPTSATPTSSIPSGSFDAPIDSSASSPPPVDPPPGVGGPPTSPEGVPDAPPPVPPTGQAPIVPTANVGGDDGSGLPIALVLALGLLTLLGLGGAQTRMLGFWGPPVPAGRGAQDARLVALGRVAESQASLQKKIAEHKHSVKHTEPV